MHVTRKCRCQAKANKKEIGNGYGSGEWEMGNGRWQLAIGRGCPGEGLDVPTWRTWRGVLADDSIYTQRAL